MSSFAFSWSGHIFRCQGLCFDPKRRHQKTSPLMRNMCGLCPHLALFKSLVYSWDILGWAHDFGSTPLLIEILYANLNPNPAILLLLLIWSKLKKVNCLRILNNYLQGKTPQPPPPPHPPTHPMEHYKGAQWTKSSFTLHGESKAYRMLS